MYRHTANANQAIQVTFKVSLKRGYCIGSQYVATVILDPITATLVGNPTRQVDNHIVTHGQFSRQVCDRYRRCRRSARVEITR